MNKTDQQRTRQITTWLKQDMLRMKALECVRLLGLPDCYIAAGFLRNLVWDHQHDKPNATPLNDVDVIYFDKKEPQPSRSACLMMVRSTILPPLTLTACLPGKSHITPGVTTRFLYSG